MITTGSCTVRSRFISPSTDSCASFYSTQFAPSPYALVDVNQPSPTLAQIKDLLEAQEDTYMGRWLRTVNDNGYMFHFGTSPMKELALLTVQLDLPVSWPSGASLTPSLSFYCLTS
jgi:hypothetical protein